jgi:HD-like signal output (HDOD) protein
MNTIALPVILESRLAENLVGRHPRRLSMSKLFSDSDSLRLVIRRNDKLGGLCADIAEIVSLTKKGTTSIREIENKVLRNPEYAARTLRMANTAAYGATNARTLNQAIAVLGLPGLRSILVSVALHAGSRGQVEGFDTGGYMRRGLAAGLLCNQFARRLKFPEPERYYLAGLLQDIGYLVVSQYAPETFSSLQRASQFALNTPLEDLERSLWGMSHAEIGGALAEEWGFDPAVVACIRFHHRPLAAPKENLDACDLANVVSAICDQAKLTPFTALRPEATDPVALQRLQLSDDDLGELCSSLLESSKEMGESIAEAA